MLSELKDDILAPVAQRIINLDEWVETAEKKIETESTELKQHNSGIACLNTQIKKISQEMKKLPTQLKTTTTPKKIKNLVIAEVEKDKNTHAKIEELT